MDAQDEQAVPAVMEQLLLQVSANPPHDWYGANLFQPDVPAGELGADEQFAAPRLLQFGQNAEENLAANDAVVGVQPPPNSQEGNLGAANVPLADDHQGAQEEQVVNAQIAEAQIADDDQIGQVALPDGDLMEVDEVALAQFAEEFDDEDVIFDRQIQWITIDSDDDDEEEEEEEEEEDEEEGEEEDDEDDDATIIVSDDDNADIADNEDEIN